MTLSDSVERCERAVHQLVQLKPVSTADFIEEWKGNAGATANAGPISAGGNYEASVIHGNKFTDSVDAAYGVANANTYSGEYQ